jgi:hypothetical protein
MYEFVILNSFARRGNKKEEKHMTTVPDHLEQKEVVEKLVQGSRLPVISVSPTIHNDGFELVLPYYKGSCTNETLKAELFHVSWLGFQLMFEDAEEHWWGIAYGVPVSFIRIPLDTRLPVRELHFIVKLMTSADVCDGKLGLLIVSPIPQTERWRGEIQLVASADDLSFSVPTEEIKSCL